jgi:hypothetical protein
MNSEIDTSTAAVEAVLSNLMCGALDADLDAAADLIRSLNAERNAAVRRADEAEAKVDALRSQAQYSVQVSADLEAEVAALRAQVCGECRQPKDLCSRCDIATECKHSGCSSFDCGGISETTQARAAVTVEAE